MNSFFEKAEEEIYEALRNYATETMDGGFRRKLFANDAEKGFAFIELCKRAKYDAVLMNSAIRRYFRILKTLRGR